MRRAIGCIVQIVALVGLSAPASAQHMIRVGYNINAGASATYPPADRIPPVVENFGGNHSTVSFVFADKIEEKFLSGREAVSSAGSASALVIAIARAERLHTGISVHAELKASNNGTQGNSGAGAGITGTNAVSALWQDTITYTDPGLPIGAPVAMECKLRLQGTAEAIVSGTADTEHHGQASVSATATIADLTNPKIVGYQVLSAVDRETHVGSVPGGVLDTLIPVAFEVRNGEPFHYEASLYVEFRGDAKAKDRLTCPCTSGAIDSELNGDFTHTFSWGEITSVTNALTGEPLTDGIITSASGFDYSHPYVVPEPSAVWLHMAAVAGLGVCWRRSSGSASRFARR